MDAAYKFTDAVLNSPYKSIGLATLALGILCGPTAAGVGGLAMGVPELINNWDAFVQQLAKMVWRAFQARVDAAKDAANATLVPIANMFSPQAGAMVNSLIDNAHAIASQLIAGGEGMTDQIIDFLKQYFMYIVLAFVAYRMLR